LKREIVITNDGSTTIHLPEWNESYHSKHGAIQEAKHVFIKNGLSLFEGKPVSVLEIGFGTGLNCFITFLEAQKKNEPVNYVGVEAYPIAKEEVQLLNYVKELEAAEFSSVFDAMHTLEWDIQSKLTPTFELTKRKQFFDEIYDIEQFDLIYFDAFGFTVQPDLWDEAIFRKMHTALKPSGVLVTYACRTIIKKAMEAVGFTTEKLPGAPGKREMLRAVKM
jgi:tRNA U34 5-methylaminomethyl-2-thiouridine-forming methyltransferase MnmC